MKKFFSFLTIIAIISVSNCSRIPENNDPVIGIWYKLEADQSDATGKQTVRQEWIFNDVYLGRYHRYNGSEVVFVTDFNWEQHDGMYTINYPGTELGSQQVEMKESAEGATLEDQQGNIVAVKQ